MKRTYMLPTPYSCEGAPKGIISNGFGSYFLIDEHMSYQGWYMLYPKEWRMQKIVESLTPVHEGECVEFVNHLYGLRRKFSSGAEDVTMMYQKTLLYQAVNFKGPLKFTFDHRESYGGNEMGREYSVDVQDDFVLLTFSYRDKKHYVGIRGLHDVNLVQQWREQHYSFDANRGSRSNFWVYDAFTAIPRTKMVLSSASSPSEARTLCDIAYFHFDDIVGNLQTQSQHNLVEYKEFDDRTNAAATLAANSIQSLHQKFFFNHMHITGIYAGYPWFFQLWSRDELISAKGMKEVADTTASQSSNPDLLYKNLLSRHVVAVLPNGMLANRYPHSSLGSSDALGWLAKRAYDFLKELQQQKKLYTIFSIDDLMLWYRQFVKALEFSKKDHYKEGLFSSEFCETWMDTAYNDDGRVGYRIEIQALYYCLYEVIIFLGNLVGSSQVKEHIKEQETFKEKVRQELYMDHILDGVNMQLQKDYAYRPNIFLAAYLAPDLFEQHKWEESFDMHLEKLFTDWGGVRTLDSHNENYQPYYTGEQNKSYHRGDTWYFVNHFTALSLLQCNKEKYAKYVAKIVSATSKDILELGLAGHCSEVSSASEQRAEACLAQAWSVATFVELVNKLKS